MIVALASLQMPVQRPTRAFAIHFAAMREQATLLLVLSSHS
jgi:hypothetical protein